MRPSAAALALATLLVSGCRGQPQGTLRLAVLDGPGGVPTPARIELVDSAGEALVAPSAMKVAGDCGWKPIHNWIGWWARVQMRRALEARVHDPTSGRDHFYVDRSLDIELEPGSYSIRVFKGPEHRVESRDLRIAAGSVTELEIPLERWIDMPSRGWFSADDHLHIARPHPSFDPLIARWMAAEDIHVANLLQMGLAQSLHITPQYALGPTSVHRHDSRLVASGQENPRTHVVGHAIVLGAPEYIDIPDDYLDYGAVFERSHRDGGLNGFAHWGLGGADEGLAVWGPHELVDFLEVLGFGLAYYQAWYDLLNLGLRVAPTAGTDYPCGPHLPGRERFYTHLDVPLSYQAWLEAVRAGRTFITNGPMLELEAAGAGIGDEIVLDGPGSVRIVARARFDPQRDAVQRLELIRAGQVVGRREPDGESAVIELETDLAIERSTWLAVRARGSKRGETPFTGVDLLRQALTFLPRPGAEELFSGADAPVPAEGAVRPASAHTGAIFVTVRGADAIAEQPAAAIAARRWLDLLDLLEARFDDERLVEMADFPGRGDGLALEDIEASRAELLAKIAASRTRLTVIANGTRE